MSLREFWCCVEVLNPQDDNVFDTDTNFFNEKEESIFKDMKIIAERRRAKAHG